MRLLSGISVTIPQIFPDGTRDSQGTKPVKNKAFASQFQMFYTSLYNLPPPLTRASKIKQFLEQHCPSPIALDIAQELDTPLTPEELHVALKQMKPGKSPGPDGFTTQYYKRYQEVLLSHFLRAFNTSSETDIHSRQLLEAHITLLPKEGKDVALVSNYRPISLLNVDLKWYAKALANRLLPLLSSIVSLDQVGFVPGREARDNVLKTLAYESIRSGIPPIYGCREGVQQSGLGLYVRHTYAHGIPEWLFIQDQDTVLGPLYTCEGQWPPVRRLRGTEWYKAEMPTVSPTLYTRPRTVLTKSPSGQFHQRGVSEGDNL